MYKNKVHNQDYEIYFTPNYKQFSFDFHNAKDEIAEEIVFPPKNKNNTQSIFSRIIYIFGRMFSPSPP